MTDLDYTRLIRKKRVREYNARGAVYSWLRAHHTDVTRCRDVERRPWSALILEMAVVGVRREDGKDLVAKNVSRVWDRVRRDIAIDAEAQAQAAARRKAMPSRRSPDWRPEVVVQQPGLPQYGHVALAPVVAPPPIRRPLRTPDTSVQAIPAAPDGRSQPPGMTPEVRAILDEAFEDLSAVDRKNFGW